MADDEIIPWEETSSFLEFKAYITHPEVTREQVLRHLVHPDADDDSAVHVQMHIGQTTQALIRHHRETTPITRNGEIHPRLFIIIDSPDLLHRGVLLVALNQYHGFDDASRGPIEDKRDQLMSLSIANDDWWTMKQVTDEDDPQAVPVRRFTAYNLLSDQEAFEKAFRKLDDGLYDVHVRRDDDSEDLEEEADNGDGDDSEWEDAEDDENAEEEDEESSDEFYTAIRPQVLTLEHVEINHPNQAQQNSRDPGMYVVIDKDHETLGPLIVRLSPAKDSFRCKGEVAGEILKWIFIDFMSWDEAKAFAAAQN